MSLSSNFLIEKDKSETQPVDLYIFTLDGDDFYYTNSRQAITYDGHTFSPLAIQRSEVSKTSDGRAQKVSLGLDNVNRDFTAWSQWKRLSGAECRIYQIFRDHTSYGHRLILSGYLLNPVFNQTFFHVDVVQFLYALQLKTPRRCYQRWCNSRFGDAACLTYGGNAESGTYTRLNDSTLDRGEDFFLGGTLTILSGTNKGQIRTISSSDNGYVEWTTPLANLITVGVSYTVTWRPREVLQTWPTSDGTTTRVNNAAHSESFGYWVDGYVYFTDGVNVGQKRKVTVSAPGYLEWKIALPYPVLSGSGNRYNLYRGCDKTIETCTEKFGNEPCFSGFIHIQQTQNLRRYGE